MIVRFDQEADRRKIGGKGYHLCRMAQAGLPVPVGFCVTADELSTIHKAGMRGIALSFVNYLDELPYFCDEVLPRLVRLGARVAH